MKHLIIMFYYATNTIIIIIVTFIIIFVLQDSVRQLLSTYLHRFSSLAGPVITCGPVLNWLELDNRGHRLIVTEDCAINTPAVAAAYAIKRYAKQANDEISFEVRTKIYESMNRRGNLEVTKPLFFNNFAGVMN